MKTILAILFFALTASAQTNFFPQLLNGDGTVLMTNAEFRTVVGRKIIFKQRETRRLKSFDVSEVSAKTLDKLNISAAKAIAEQKEIDAQKAKAAQVRAQQAAIIAEQQRIRAIEVMKRNAELAKQAAKQAEIDERKRKENELHRLEVQQKQADIDETRAEAARARAAAGYYNRTP